MPIVAVLAAFIGLRQKSRTPPPVHQATQKIPLVHFLVQNRTRDSPNWRKLAGRPEQ